MSGEVTIAWAGGLTGQVDQLHMVGQRQRFGVGYAQAVG